jgi:uncharacterized membrane protein required for colicin V production
MKLAFKFLLLLLHYAIAGIACYYIGDFISSDVNILIVLLGGLLFSFIMIFLITVTLQFILSLKKQIKQ